MSRPQGAGDPAELTERFAALRSGGDRTLRNQLVAEHLSLAEACARRFANRGEPLDDLEQVAMVGLVKAVERFDPDAGVPFAGFAVPTIRGELLRHFRDATWAAKVPRGAKDLHVRVRAAVDRLSGELERSPTPVELAEALGVGVDQVLDALDAGAAYRSASTDTPEGQRAADAARAESSDESGVSAEDRLRLVELLRLLPERERRIVGLRFFEGLTQSEIAEQLGLSQVHVSRLLRAAMRSLREAAGPDEGQI